MKIPSSGTPEFWRLYRALPQEVRAVARKNYLLWAENPFHPSLHFKPVGKGRWSARVGLHYRALGRFSEEAFVWDWIGAHDTYDQQIG